MQQIDKTQRIEISAKTIVFTVVFLLSLRLLWMVKDLLFSLFIAFIVMSAVKPVVSFFESKKIPRQLTTVVVFLCIMTFFVLILSWIVPPFVIETTLLVKHMPDMIKKLNPGVFGYVNLNSLTQYVPNITNQAFSFVGTLFSNVIFVTSTLFFSAYLTIDKDIMKKIFSKFFPSAATNRIVGIFEKSEKRMGAWLTGELILMTVVGLLTFIGLSLIGVKYALPLAILAGLLEVVPNIGPVISTIPAFIVAVTQSYFLGFSSIALYFIVQQLENNIIVPLVMRSVVGVNPIITLIALIVGGRVGGMLGVLLAIPLTLFIETVLVELFQEKKA